ncbi:MAG: hypothetical protein ACFE68_01060 [Candidatus Hodarchaeota archaeon]
MVQETDKKSSKKEKTGPILPLFSSINFTISPRDLKHLIKKLSSLGFEQNAYEEDGKRIVLTPKDYSTFKLFDAKVLVKFPKLFDPLNFLVTCCSGQLKVKETTEVLNANYYGSVNGFDARRMLSLSNLLEFTEWPKELEKWIKSPLIFSVFLCKNKKTVNQVIEENFPDQEVQWIADKDSSTKIAFLGQSPGKHVSGYVQTNIGDVLYFGPDWQLTEATMPDSIVVFIVDKELYTDAKGDLEEFGQFDFVNIGSSVKLSSLRVLEIIEKLLPCIVLFNNLLKYKEEIINILAETPQLYGEDYRGYLEALIAVDEKLFTLDELFHNAKNVVKTTISTLEINSVVDYFNSNTEEGRWLNDTMNVLTEKGYLGLLSLIEDLVDSLNKAKDLIQRKINIVNLQLSLRREKIEITENRILRGISIIFLGAAVAEIFSQILPSFFSNFWFILSVSLVEGLGIGLLLLCGFEIMSEKSKAVGGKRKISQQLIILTSLSALMVIVPIIYIFRRL